MWMDAKPKNPLRIQVYIRLKFHQGIKTRQGKIGGGFLQHADNLS